MTTIHDLRHNCRICFQDPQSVEMMDMDVIYDNDMQLSYYDCYEICTSTDLRKHKENEAKSLCKSCSLELLSAYDFHKKVSQANQQWEELHLSLLVKGQVEDQLLEEEEEHLIESVVDISAVSIVEPKQFKAQVESADDGTYEVLTRQRRSGKYTCEFCSKRFPNYSRMMTHQLIHMSDRPLYNCSHCDHVYLTKQSLKVHVEAKHEKSGFTCTTCGKVYAIRKGLEIHMRYHTGDFPFACDECDRRYAQRSHLNVHKLVKHGSARFICEYPNCEKSFTSSSSLRSHECSHYTSLPFECSHCQQGFPTRAKLRTHVRRKHNIELTQEQLESMRKYHVARSKLVMAVIDT